MIVHIIRENGFVQAMGHRVALDLGGEAELKRRVLGTMAQLDDPPNEVRFERLEPAAAATAAPAEPSEPEPVAEPTEGSAEPAEVEPEPEPKPKPPPRRRR